MFEGSPRRHPVQTFQFWFVVLACFGAATIWKLDWISLPQSSRLPVVANEPLPPPPAGDSGLAPPNLQRVYAPPAAEQTASALPAQSDVIQAAAQSDWTSESAAPAQPLVRTAAAELPETAPRPAAARHAEGPAPADDASPASFDVTEADRLIEAGDEVAAHRLLSSWYWKYAQQRPALMNRLNRLAGRIYFQPQPHYIDPYVVQFGERLETIGKKYRVPWEYLARLNRIEPDKLRAGQNLKVLQGPFSAVVDLRNYELTVHAHGYYVTRFKVGIGKADGTPIGVFKVTDKVTDPDYYGPHGVVSRNDPANPLGERWLAINDEQGTLQGYGIHGTIDPASIGRAESQGCVRLADGDIEALYDLLVVGSEVIIRR
jgi:LysM repeat protein